MKLDWDRPGLVRATLKVEELAALVAGARLAAAALAAQSPEQAGELERVLAGFDRALTHLGPVLDRDGVNPTVGDELSDDETTTQAEGANT
jgi:hypothetical protein